MHSCPQEKYQSSIPKENSAALHDDVLEASRVTIQRLMSYVFFFQKCSNKLDQQKRKISLPEHAITSNINNRTREYHAHKKTTDAIKKSFQFDSRKKQFVITIRHLPYTGTRSQTHLKHLRERQINHLLPHTGTQSKTHYRNILLLLAPINRIEKLA